ncbi:MAG: zinc ribbon domain-containing protein, partial [Acidobacteria bacterium]|nr:zinc ribbon domain-containing protein [Acidobacteriota bacterium]
MPLYEYQCESCSHRFERIQKFSDPPADTCPQCSGKVRKLISSPAIQFKGSGFY